MDFQIEGIEKLKNLICVTFEKLEYDAVNNIIKALGAAGLENYDDLDCATEADVKDYLKPIQFRKLMKAFKNGVQNQADSLIENDGTVANETVNHHTTNHEPPTINSFVSITSNNQPSSSKVSMNNDIVISWHHMPAELMQDLKESKIPRPSLRTAMVRVIADDIMDKTKNPTKSYVHSIAAKVANLYPDSLMDKLNDVTVGYMGLSKQIYNRIENEGRKTRRAYKERRSQQVEQTAKKPCSSIDSYGCVMWAPPCPDNVSAEMMETKKKMLCEIFKENPQSAEVAVLMSETYYLQRVEINSGCSLSELRENWPALFTLSGLLEHFKILTNVDLNEQLTKSFELRAKDIVKYLKTLTVKNICQHFWMIEKIKEPDEVIFIVASIAAYFKEDISLLFKASEVCSPHHLDGKIDSTPMLIMKGSSIFESQFYMLTCDGQIIADYLEGSLNAVSALFSLYFVLNLKYPDGIKVTLEFFQRCLVGINPETGTKAERRDSKKLYCGVNPKICTFLQKLSNFNCWTKDVRFSE